MKILLIDDHELVAECLSYTLMKSGKCEYVKIMTDIPAAIEAILNGEFDLVLLDINLKRISDKDGLVLAKEILQRDPNIKIIMLTGYDLPILEIEAQKIGARGFICKDLQLDKLMNIIERIMSGEKVFKENYLYLEKLTNTERRVLELYCAGKTRKEITKELFISMRTLSNHINLIYQKLHVTNYQEMVRKAIRLGYIKTALP